VQAKPIVVAQSIHVTVIGFRIVTWEDLCTCATSEGVTKAAGTIVRVGSYIAACACRRRSARIACTVVNIIAGLTIAAVARWAGVTGEAGGWGGLVVAVHFRMVEARTVRTAVRIGA
jgi:hypothetical protein